MKVSTINLACWCASGVFVLGLFGFALQHKKLDGKNMDDEETRAFAGQVLAGPPGTEEAKLPGPDYKGEVQPYWHRLNWTGAPPPVDEGIERGPKEPVEKPRKTMTDVLAIYFIQYDTDDPGGSKVWVRWKEATMKDKPDQFIVGDVLPDPYTYAVVHKIHPESVEFSFTVKEGETEAAENESVEAFNDTNRTPIVNVVDGQVIQPKRDGVPQRIVKAAPKTRSREITPNTWQLGSEDVTEFGADYQRILTQDVRTRTHYDANGKRAGVEITEVKPGSIAARHGAQEGDIVISINGNVVGSEQEAIKYVKNNSDTTSVWEVVVENMGRRSTRVYRSPED